MTTRQLMAITVSVVGFSVTASGVSLEPLANDAYFYPFSEKAAGTSWTHQNQTTPKEAYNTGMYGYGKSESSSEIIARTWSQDYGKGISLVVTSEVPGAYLYSGRFAKRPISNTHQGIAYVGGAGNSCFDSGTSFAALLGHAQESTVEFFYKRGTQTGNTQLCWFDYGSGDGAHRLQIYAPYANLTTLYAYMEFTGKDDVVRKKSDNYSMFDANAVCGGSAVDGKWHHVAIVCSATSGKGRLYFDYMPAAQEMDVNIEDVKTSIGVLRLGYAATVVSGLRVTERALTPNEFLYASDSADGMEVQTIAWYPFDDNPAGTEYAADVPAGTTKTWASVARNLAEAGTLYGSGKSASMSAKASTAASGVLAVQTNDVPARYVYAGLRSTSPLKELQSALWKVNSTTLGYASSKITIPGVNQDMSRSGAWTAEMFVKFHTVSKNAFWYFDLNVAATSRPIFSVNPDRPYLTRWNYSGTNRVSEYPDLTTICDGRWHHLAMVYENGVATVYCDYSIVCGEENVPVQQELTNSLDSFTLLASESTMCISSVRVTRAALSPREFLYASDSANGVLASQGWRWPLDGTAGSALTFAENAEPFGIQDSDQYFFRNGSSLSGLPVGTGAVYADSVIEGRVFLGSTRLAKNAGAMAVGSAYLKGDAVKNPLCDLGRMFTLETAFRVSSAPTEGRATVIGAETLAGTPAWTVAADAAGDLWFTATLIDGSTVDRKLAAGVVGKAMLTHVVFDAVAQNVDVYLGDAKALTLTAADFSCAIADGSTPVVGGGAGNTILSGAVDEVRFVRSLLQPEAFEDIVKRGLILVVQ